MHLRAQIRDAVVALLAGLPATQERVYHGRTRPLTPEQLPCLLVYATEEAQAIDAQGAPATLERMLTLVIEGRAEGDPPDDVLDVIAAEVEARLADRVLIVDLMRLVLEITPTVTRVTAQSSGARQLGEIRQEYRVIYRTREGAPDKAV